MTAPVIDHCGTSRNENRMSRFSLLLDRTSTPLGFEGGDTNLYRYVGNNPINRIDPSGNQEETAQQETNEELALILTAMFDAIAVEDRNFAIGWSAFKSSGGEIVVGEFWSNSSWGRVPDPDDWYSTIGVRVFVDASQIRKEGIGWGFEQAKIQLKKAILSVFVRLQAPVTDAFEYATYELQRRTEAFQEACSQIYDLLNNVKDGAELLVSLTPTGDLLMSVKDVAEAGSEAERWTNITISILPGSNEFWRRLALYGSTALGGIAAVVIKKVGEARFVKQVGKWVPVRAFAKKAGAFNQAKELAGIPPSQQPVRQWTIRGDHKDFPSGATVRHPEKTHHGRVYEYEVVGPGGEKQYKYIVVHENDPIHGGIGHVHAAQSKAGPTHRLEPGESYRNIDSGVPISFDSL